MPNSSFKYFVKDKTQNVLTSSVYGYFDFDVPPNSDLINQAWLDSGVTLLVDDINSFSNSGFLSFNGSRKFAINGLDKKNIAFFIPYYLDSKKENVLISSKVDSVLQAPASGYTFGINKLNFPYVEFHDSLLGPTTYCLREPLNSTGIVYFGVKNNSVQLGYYDATEKRTKKYEFPKNKNYVIDSNSWYLGGSSAENSQNLNGRITQIAIADPSSTNTALYEKNIISGLIYDLGTIASTGFVSGQTGILEGDIIFVTGCYYYYALSGQIYSGEQQTGISYYTSTGTFVDCIGREYTKFTQNILSGYFSGFRWVQYLNQNCFFNTGYNFLQYDSGFSINYLIKTFLPSVKYPEIDNLYVNSIFLKEPIDTVDTLSIYALSQVDKRIDPFDVLYNIFNKTYFIDGSINTSYISGFYYNGQLQTISDEVAQALQNNEIVYLPNRDFFISGSKIYSNQYYDFGNINIDSWPTFDFVFTGFVPNGSALPGVNFSNQMVFLNGQKLVSGKDYEGDQILFDIPSGYNVLSVTRNKLNFFEKIITNSGTNSISLDFFTKNTSSVWLNGIRLKNEIDYNESLYVNYVGDIFTKNGGTLIFQKDGN